jgi:Lysyl oxidase/WD40-like Beta Propeller Repeat
VIVAHGPEPRAASMLVAETGAVAAVAPDGTRRPLLTDARDATYSPDGTLVAFVRDGDLWLANADGSGQRALARTPNVGEWDPAWLPSGQALVYTASVNGQRQIRLIALPLGPSHRIAASGAEEYSPVVSRSGRLAFVSTRGGTPVVYTAQADGNGAAAFDSAPAAIPPVAIRDLAWSPDGTRLAFTAQNADATTNVVVDDGTTQTVLSVAPAHDEHPVWSQTGSRIAFDDGAGNLASVAAGGGDRRNLGTGAPLDWRVVPAGRPEFPNLVQRPPSELVVTRSPRGRWLLGFTSMVDNRGPGILWIRGTRAPGAHVMQVRQLVQLEGGGTRVMPDSGELHYAVAPPHYHWHFIGFDRYELLSAGDLRLLVRDRKSGFCIADHYGTALGVPHGPPRFLGNCAQFQPKARAVEEGSSVGYTDRYPAFFHGQALDITHVPPGRYWLVHRVNSDFHLREEHYGDDTASLLVQISWPDGRSAEPRVATLQTCLRELC